MDRLSDEEFKSVVTKMHASLLQKIQTGTMFKLQKGVKDKFGSKGVRFFMFDPSDEEFLKAKILIDNDTSLLFTEEMYND